MNENINICDNRVQSGYSTLFLVKEPGETLYSLLVTSESVPSIFGSPDTFEFDLLQCKTKGFILGKDSLETGDMDFMWHRDNILRLESLQNKVLDFLVVYKDFTGRSFSGSLRVRPNEASAEILKGTMTIIPISANTTTLLDCRDLIKDTVYFDKDFSIPDSITITTVTGASLKVKTSPFLTTLSVSCDNANFVFVVTQPATTIPGSIGVSVTTTTPGASPQYGIAKITATATNYAPWTTTIAVNY